MKGPMSQPWAPFDLETLFHISLIGSKGLSKPMAIKFAVLVTFWGSICGLRTQSSNKELLLFLTELSHDDRPGNL